MRPSEPNARMTMRHSANPHTLTGDVQLHRDFHSRFLAQDRDLIVYFPPGYQRGGAKRYPVLYLHDGQNLFDGATSFKPGGEWGVDESAEHLIRAGEIEPLIIVGVYSRSVDRVDEYTPTLDDRLGSGGSADLYGRMLVEELKPFIDSRCQTLEGSEHAGLGGSSLGGLVSLYLGLKYPHVFGKLASISPSASWDHRMIVHEVASLPSKPHLRIWLDIGAAEGDAVKALRGLRDALLSKGWKLDKDLAYSETLGAAHDERAWAKRVGPVLRFLFPATKRASPAG